MVHDDIIKWTHFPCYWPFVQEIHWSPVNSPHKGQWRGALMFSLICAWTKCWINNQDAEYFETPWQSLWCHCKGLNGGHIVPWNPANFSQNLNENGKIFFQETALDSGCSKSDICSGLNVLKRGGIRRIWAGTLVWAPSILLRVQLAILAPTYLMI